MDLQVPLKFIITSVSTQIEFVTSTNIFSVIDHRCRQRDRHRNLRDDHFKCSLVTRLMFVKSLVQFSCLHGADLVGETPFGFGGTPSSGGGEYDALSSGTRLRFCWQWHLLCGPANWRCQESDYIFSNVVVDQTDAADSWSVADLLLVNNYRVKKVRNMGSSSQNCLRVIPETKRSLPVSCAQ